MLLEIITAFCAVLILYILIGYNAIIWALAVFFPKPVKKADMTPRVSIIIAAYNEAEFIGTKIRNIFELDYPQDKLEIILVSDGSTDGTEAIGHGEGQGRVKVFHYAERKGKPTALNMGLENATGDIILFSDARPLFQPGTLRLLMPCFADPDVGCVSGRHKFVHSRTNSTQSGHNSFFASESALNRNESRSGSTMSVQGALCAVRRELVDPIPPDTLNDDAYILLGVLRAKKRALWEEEAVCLDLAPKDSRQDTIRRIRIFTGRLQVLCRTRLWRSLPPATLWRYASHKLMRVLPPFLMIICFFIPIMGLLFTASQAIWMTAFLLVQCVFYGLVLIGWVLDKNGRKFFLFSLPFFVFRSLFAVFPAIWRSVFGRDNVRWTKARREAGGG